MKYYNSPDESWLSKDDWEKFVLIPKGQVSRNIPQNKMNELREKYADKSQAILTLDIIDTESEYSELFNGLIKAIFAYWVSKEYRDEKIKIFNESVEKLYSVYPDLDLKEMKFSLS